MPCPRLRHANPDGARFCNACGAKLVAACPACAHVNPPGSRFCNACGQHLAVPPPSAQPETPPTSELAREPLSYIPQHLAEKILTASSALEGERKQVTVLFADLKDSTELITDLDPEDAQQLLDPAIHIMMDAVHRFEGTVNQVLGDGIMALFGAPIAHEDHAARACYAASGDASGNAPVC
jgi:hypothetical protein